jgi:hypothetical protein
MQIRCANSLLCMCLIISGCAGQAPRPVPQYRYLPAPAIAEVVRGGANGETPLSVSVWADRVAASPDAPSTIEVRMRFDAHGPVGVRFDPNSLELVNGSLEPFPRAAVNPSAVLDLAPGHSADVTARFPFTGLLSNPSADVQYLRLRWQVQIAGEVVPQDVTFSRVYLAPPPTGPTWGY